MKANCDFCFRRCSIEEGKTGWCRVRENDSGTIVSRNCISAIALDPIEKKPLYHFLPGTKTLSFGASGCSLSCDFCQNWELSQQHEKGSNQDIMSLIDEASAYSIPSVSFTYSEPLVWQDEILELSPHIKAHGMKTVMVTSGTFSESSLLRLVPLIDAYNIDLKGDEDFYRTICHGSITPVIDSIGYLVSEGKHVEVTTLLIEGIHDAKMLLNIARMLHDAGVSVWHITRFFPAYKMSDRKATSESFLKAMISELHGGGIPYIYPGNSMLEDETRCPRCNTLINRYRTKGICPECGCRIYGVWNHDTF